MCSSVAMLLGVNFCLMFCVVKSTASIVSTTASVLGRDKKISSPAAFRSFASPRDRYECLEECRQESVCVAFNFEDMTGSCELLKAIKGLADVEGWTAYQWLQEFPPRLLDPCASADCGPDRVCVAYRPPAYDPNHLGVSLNYSMSGYVCSNHSWLLQQRNDGKTDCWYVSLAGKYLTGENDDWRVEPFYRIFVRCEEVNCLSVYGTYTGSNPIVGTLDSSPLTGGELEDGKNCISWYPRCT